jgi:hypothetical protein
MKKSACWNSIITHEAHFFRDAVGKTFIISPTRMKIQNTCNLYQHYPSGRKIWYNTINPWKAHGRHTKRDQERCIVADKEQKKVQKAAPKSNKQKKEAQREKKAAKSGKTL